MDIEGKKILIVGAGKIAFDKAEKILMYHADIVVIAPKKDPSFNLINDQIHFIEKSYEQTDLDDVYAVIAATDSNQVNEMISQDAKKKGIPVNVVDDKEKSTFIFPAIIKEDDLTIAISSQGISPSLTVYLKKQIQKLLPVNLKEILRFLKEERKYIALHVIDSKKRSCLYHWLFEKSWSDFAHISHQDVKDKVVWINREGKN
jgi:siroheme synthase-like protein